jgi:hypothetical protein
MRAAPELIGAPTMGLGVVVERVIEVKVAFHVA